MRIIYLFLIIFIPSVYASDLDNRDEKPISILSIHGGGGRGIIPATILEHIEDGLLYQLGEQPYLAEYFDIMAGTSTGGIITLGLNVPNPYDGELRHPLHTAKHIAQMYQEKKGDKSIFPGNTFFDERFLNYVQPKHNPATFQEKLESNLMQYKLSETISNVVIPAYSMRQALPFVFTTFDARKTNKKNFFMKDVAYATGTAPTFFPPKDLINVANESMGDFMDGGLFANDPTYIALEKAFEAYPKARSFFILSLGTGEATRKRNNHNNHQTTGILAWAKLLPDIFMNTNALRESEHLKHLIKSYTQVGYKFEHIEVQVNLDPSEEKMDSLDINLVDKLKGAAESYVYYDGKDEMERIVKRLKSFKDK
jgi:patatin-like phospholipase/acyl hydrolase